MEIRPHITPGLVSKQQRVKYIFRRILNISRLNLIQRKM